MPSTKSLVLIVTGSDSGFGLLTARALAQEGHVVYGGLFKSNDGAYPKYADLANFSAKYNCNLYGIHLNIVKDDSINSAITQIIAEQGRIDGIIHNAGHMSLGPAEAFTPEQFMDLYDTNCVGCHRLNRAVLPHMRAQRSGLLVWVSSSSAHGPSSPYLSAYFAAKAAQDSLAQTTALEVSQFGIETSIVTPGIFTSGTNHFGSALKPADQAIEREYEEGSMKGWQERCLDGSSKMGRLDIQPQSVADSIVRIVGTEHGKRLWRSHVEPEGPMAERVNEVRDAVRREYLERMGCGELMKVKVHREQ
jgi:NAD(P)-dependent dehydrogenase (short-subunit alcohol dehydrogenase family)